MIAAPILDGALCAETDPDLFFPEQGSHSAVAKTICAVCPAVQECAEWALSQPENLYGIWGGLSASERKVLRAGRQKAPREPKRSCGTPAGARQHYRLGERCCPDCRRAERLRVAR